MSTLGLLLGLSACGLGDAGTGDDVGDADAAGDNPARIPSPDPAVDERLDTLGIVCESTLIVTGSYVQGEPPPDGHTGCWSVGDWSIQATVDFQGCDPQPDFPDAYVYDVTRVDDSSTVVFTNDPADERVNLKITTTGDGLCHGAFDHYSVDRRVLALRPTVELDGTITGNGTFSVYQFDPF